MNAQAAGNCSVCGGPVTCRYNHFEKPGLVIDSWEHKCSDCGKRETQAFRQEGESVITRSNLTCPYCNRTVAQ